MTGPESMEQSLSNFIGTHMPANAAETPAPPAAKDTVAAIDLWSGTDDLAPAPEQSAGGSGKLQSELETLTLERERLKNEHKKLLEELEGLKIEEDIAELKKEIGVLGGENAQLLNEIQRRRQAIAQGPPQ